MAVDLKQWRKGITYDVRAALGDVVADVQAMENLHLAVEAESSRFWRRLLWLALGLLVAIVVFAFIVPVVSAGLLFFGGGGVIIAMLWGLFHYYQKPEGLYRPAVMQSILTAVSHDSNLSEKLHAKLVLSDGNLPHKETPIPNRKKGKEKHFRDEWLEMEGEFLDGVVWSFAIIHLRRIRYWTNPRGKSKNKTRSFHLCTLRLRYPAERYGSPDVPAPVFKKAIRLPGRAICKASRVSQKDLVLKALVMEQKDLASVGPMMFLSLYKILNGMRRQKIQAAKGSQ